MCAGEPEAINRERLKGGGNQNNSRKYCRREKKLVSLTSCIPNTQTQGLCVVVRKGVCVCVCVCVRHRGYFLDVGVLRDFNLINSPYPVWQMAFQLLV